MKQSIPKFEFKNELKHLISMKKLCNLIETRDVYISLIQIQNPANKLIL